MARRHINIIYQREMNDCGASCLAMISDYYGHKRDLSEIKHICGNSRNGISVYDINIAAQKLGFATRAVKLNFEYLKEDVHHPCVIYWMQKHFIVVYHISQKWVYVADPAIGKVKYRHTEFMEKWSASETGEGIALLLSDLNAVDTSIESPTSKKRYKMTDILRYAIPHKKNLIAVLILLLLSGMAGFALPLLTQVMFDYGIAPHKPHIILLVLLGSLMITIGDSLSRFLQMRIVLTVGTKINIDLVKRVLCKLTLLPTTFFDNCQSGDILQRISDTSRIETFITSSLMDIVTSAMTFIVSAVLLFHYSTYILVIYIVSIMLYYLWLSRFMRRRKILDYKKFNVQSRSKEEIIEFVKGSQEIKLSNCSNSRIFKWDTIQQELFAINKQDLRLTQTQRIGVTLLSKITDMVILYFTAVAVLEGYFTIGCMLAIQAIIGGMKYPAEQITYFIQVVQDSKISLSRLDAIYSHPNEKDFGSLMTVPKIERQIEFRNVSFSYGSTSYAKTILKNINIIIPCNKTTAIVGASGSGKSTILRLLLGLYAPHKGEIFIGNHNLDAVDLIKWRDMCGTVLQNSYLFNETILSNIAMSEDNPDIERVKEACKIACIDDFINSLPLGYNTIIGADGMKLSSGQRQRVLIARAVYKNPQVVIFDEATNALDAVTESRIYQNLNIFFKKRTAIVAAHRLSTIRNADQIIVMSYGKIAEVGTHEELMNLRGVYSNLIMNQV